MYRPFFVVVFLGPGDVDWAQYRITISDHIGVHAPISIKLASSQHGHSAEHISRRVWGGIALRNAGEMREKWSKTMTKLRSYRAQVDGGGGGIERNVEVVPTDRGGA